MSRLAGSYQRLLEVLAADPTLKISELPMPSEAEHQQLLVE